MKELFYSLMIFLIAAVTVSSCQEVDTYERNTEIEVAGTTAINYLKSVPNSGGSVELIFNSELDWKIECSEKWLSSDPATGKGGKGVVTIYVDNTSIEESRTATITIINDQNKEIINVTQVAHVAEAPIHGLDVTLKAFLASKEDQASIHELQDGVWVPTSNPIDANEDGEISYAEAKVLQYLNCAYRNIETLDGIEHFTNLVYLDCSDNPLAIELDLSSNTKLVEFMAMNGGMVPMGIKKLDVTNCPDLTILELNENWLETIDLTKNTKLVELSIAGNRLTSIDLSKNTKLKIVKVYENMLTELDLTANTELESLIMYTNQIASMDFSKNPDLNYISCFSNELEEIDFSSNPKLISLYCQDNNLKKLNVSNTSLTYLECQTNQITNINLTGCDLLSSIKCYANKLTEMDLSDCTMLRTIECNNNELTALDVSENTNISVVLASTNKLKTINVTGCTKLTKIHFAENEVSTIDLSTNINLVDVMCINNELTSLNVDACAKMTHIMCQNNKLTTLNTPMTSLKILYCSGNMISSLDVSHVPVYSSAYVKLIVKCDPMMGKGVTTDGTNTLATLTRSQAQQDKITAGTYVWEVPTGTQAVIK